MKVKLLRVLRSLLFAAGVGWGLTLAGNFARGQEAPPPAPDAAAKGTPEEAQPAPEGAKKGAESAKKTAPTPDASRSDGEGPPAAGGQSRARPQDPSRDLREDARDAARETREGDRDSSRKLREEGQEPGREAREPSRDLPDRARNAPRDLPDDASDAARDFRENARDARSGARDFRDERERLRDDRGRDERDSARGEPVRPRQDAPRDGSRNGLDDARSELRDDRTQLRDDRSQLRADRSQFRDDRADLRADRTQLRGSVRDSQSLRSSSSLSQSGFNTANLRSADLGLWLRSSGQGLVISDVATAGPMGMLISQIGFREGDQIVSVDGYRVTRDADFMRYLLADNVLNDQVPVVVMRGGQRTTLYVEPIRLIQQVQAVQYDPLQQLGIILDDRSVDRVLVWRVVPRSPAFYAGIQPGDVITTFQGQRVTGPDTFAQLVERAQPGIIPLEINRNQRIRQLDVELAQANGPPAARTALRPNFDDPTVERLSERREDRIEDRREMRLEGNDGYVVPSNPAPAAGPIRRALFPRLRGR